MILLDVLSVLGVLLGTLFLIFAALGVARFPDFYTRLHAAGKGDTLGLTLVLLGLMASAGLTLVSLKLAFIVFFVFLFNPTATHALARGAWVCGIRPWRAGDPAFLPREGQMSDGDRVEVVEDHTGGP